MFNNYKNRLFLELKDCHSMIIKRIYFSVSDTQRSIREHRRQASRTRPFFAKPIKDSCMRPESTTNCKYSIYIYIYFLKNWVYLFKRDKCLDILSCNILSKLRESYISGEIKLIA